jgi:sigma-B regulation protein RsbU (phosphoserine phosphatase)
MQNIINKSFAKRLIFSTLLATIIIFVVAFGVFYVFSKDIIEKNATTNSKNILSITNLKIDNVLQQVETVVHNISKIHFNKNIHIDSLYQLTANVLANNPYIYGCAIAFEPSYYKQQGYYFSPYAYKDTDGSIKTKQLGNEKYDYFNMDWYATAKQKNAPNWSEPYFDEGGGQNYFCTYSVPIYDENNKFIGIFTADISLDWLTDMVSKMQHSEDSYTFIIDNKGRYIEHYIKERILNMTFFDAINSMTDTSLLHIGESMIAGKSGMGIIDNDGVPSYVFYAPVKRTNWSIAIVLPYDDVFGQIRNVNRIVLLIFAFGLLLLVLFGWKIVNHLVKPLSEFAISARHIATGNFNVKLPNITSNDEIKELSDAFCYMQKELANYIDDLRTTTANKEKIESELRIARDIQMSMIPRIFPPFPKRNDIDIYAILQPAKEVGGDLYDFFLEDDTLYFVIGDVSGKGVPASLFMAVTLSIYRSIATHLHSPEAIVTALNNTISENNDALMFVTLFVGALDLLTGEMLYCNAGHNPPVLATYNNDAQQQFMQLIPNLPIGLMHNYKYVGQRCNIQPHTKIILYTDGVTEAENADKQQFSNTRLIDAISTNNNKTSTQLVQSISHSINDFVQDTAPSDDITILIIDFDQTCSREYNKSITIQNRIEEILQLNDFINFIGNDNNLQPNKITAIQIAIEEAVSNVVKFAYPKDTNGMINLNVRRQINNDTDELIFEIVDSGIPFDPTITEMPDTTLPALERPIGGLGILIIKKTMDWLTYKRENAQNILTMALDMKKIMSSD